jgi:hypothetical protein
MSEVHWIAHEVIRTSRDDPFRRHIHAGTAAGTRKTISAHKPLLQIAPHQQRRPPGHDCESAAMKYKLERHYYQRT